MATAYFVLAILFFILKMPLLGFIFLMIGVFTSDDDDRKD